LLQKSLKRRKVSPQAIVTKRFDAPLDTPSLSVGGFTHNPAFLSSVSLKWRAHWSLLILLKPRAQVESPPKLWTFHHKVFNIMGFLEIFRFFLIGFLEMKPEIFRTFLEKFLEDF